MLSLQTEHHWLQILGDDPGFIGTPRRILKVFWLNTGTTSLPSALT
jgi:hypothetical protein